MHQQSISIMYLNTSIRMGSLTILVGWIILNSLLLAEKSIDASFMVQSPCYCLHQVIDQTKNSVTLIFYLDGTKERLLVVEQRGVVSKYEIGGYRINTFMDIQDRVVISNNFGESRGLLSIALDPYFNVTGKVYAYYIRNDDGKEYAYISVFTAANGAVDPKSEKYLLRVYQPFIYGNGGPMLFGDDGYLYIVTGDGGEDDDLTGRAQSLNTFHGKVLRIDVKQQSFTDGESGVALLYSVPKSNPFVNVTNARREVFALGIRNIWGCSQDSKTRPGGTGRIFCAETGKSKFDEINIIQSGRNYGWSLVEGTECRNVSGCSSIENEELPIYEFVHTDNHALVGGHVYRGQELSQIAGAGYYIFGDVITGKTYYLQETKSGNWSSYEWNICKESKCPPNARQSKLTHILCFGQDQKGEIYLAMTNELVPESKSGKILKLVSPNSSATDLRPFAVLVIAYATMGNWIGLF